MIKAITVIRNLDDRYKNEPKKIEILFKVRDTGEWYEAENRNEATEWDNIDLIRKNWRATGLDLMHLYENDGDAAVMALGHYNDGIL
jgi:hypothetical protein